MKYFVYYNLHKKIFSLKNHTTKLVDGYSNYLVLKNCTFKVSEKGRQRVLKEKRKNVHAGVLGTLTQLSIHDYGGFIELTYNPYKYDSFVTKIGEVPVTRAEVVILDNKKIYARGAK